MRREDAAALLAQLHRAQNRLYQGGDPAEVHNILAPNIAGHVPGDNGIAGDHHGHDAVIAYMEIRLRMLDT